MRHRIGSALRRLGDLFDHTHCPYCGTDDLVCCNGRPCLYCPDICIECDGSGNEIINVEPDGIVHVGPCNECGGTGHVDS